MKVHIKKDVSHQKKSKVKNNRTIIFSGIVFSFLFGAFFVVQFERLFPDGIKHALGTWSVEKGHDALGDNRRLRDKIINIPGLYLNTLMQEGNDELPQLYIDITFKRFKKLQEKRIEALQLGVLVKSKDDFVPAKIRYKNSTTKVKLRLKGDWTDHLEGRKWSLRIHTKGKSHLFSMRRFSIQNPKARGFQGEILFHETLSPFNIITPNYFFVNIIVNGEDIGIMALEEHFSKELLESNGRKEGVVIRFDESLVWDANDGINRGFKGVFDSYLNADIDAFRTSKIQKSERLSKEYQIAVGLLRGFNSGKLTASEVFDIEQMGSYLAVSQFWGAWHALRWHNLRFYLNPLTMRLEPIAYDGNIQDRRQVGEDIISEEPMAKRMLQDIKLQAVFNKVLNHLNKQALSGDLAKKLKIKVKPILDSLQYEYFFLDEFDYNELEERAKSTFKQQESPIDVEKFPVFVHAYVVTDGKDNYLELSNPLPYPVEVRKILWKDKSENSIVFKPKKVVDYPLELIPTTLGDLPVTKKISYKPLITKSKMQLYVEANIVGHNENRIVSVKSSYPSLSASPMPHLERQKMLEHNRFIEWSKTTISVKPGIWQVHGSIVVPTDHLLEIPAGTTLQFEDNAGIVSYGTTRFLGTQNAPIVLDGIPTVNGDLPSWQGMVVHKASERSLWSYVQVNNTTGINWPLWSLTGGITFFKSDIDLINCTFRGNKAEDALNIVHANFDLKNVSIIGTTSDGFDGDFVTGKIQGGLFQDIGLAGGGDGIDFSGSEVVVEDTHFIRINDKAISAGEGSTLTVQSITVEDSGVGAASKDHSKLKIKNSSIRNASIAGLMSYVKKPEYGSTMLVADKMVIIDTERPAVVQTGSRLSLNGENIQSVDLDIEKLYKTVMKPGLR